MNNNEKNENLTIMVQELEEDLRKLNRKSALINHEINILSTEIDAIRYKVKLSALKIKG